MTLSILMMRMAIKVAFCDRRKGMKPWGPRFRKSDHKAPRGGGGPLCGGRGPPALGPQQTCGARGRGKHSPRVQRPNGQPRFSRNDDEADFKAS